MKDTHEETTSPKGGAAEQADNQSEMSKRDTEILTAETHKLEALGVVLRNGSQESFICANNQPLHPHPGRGRKRLYQSGAKRQRAYRDRRHVSGVTK